MNRRELLGWGVKAGLLAAVAPLAIRESQAAPSGPYAAAFARLDEFVAQYLQEMHAPGLTLSLADASGVQRVVTYGLEDRERQVPLAPARMFHIGSISKSFLGLCLVQLGEEGKLDLHRPVRDYLPWLRFDDAAAPGSKPITTHALLTHSAALPDGALFPPDPAFRHQATATPGTYFHYCNMGYEAMGLLLAHLDGGSLADSLRRRVLAPLGMTSSEPVIRLDDYDRTAASYTPKYGDRPFPRAGELVRATPMNMSSAAGSIVSTAADMGTYVQMLIRRGEGPRGRIVSPAGFALFAQRHMAAEHFGPGAAYGYGIANDQLDGHLRLRHTGGMVSFASAMEIDMDTGVGGFASINAMQGYRPRPVVEYALQLMRAAREGRELPALPAPNPSHRVPNAADYAGRYTMEGGRALEVAADGERLVLLHAGQRVALELAGEDTFIALHPDFALFPLVFGRAGDDGKGAVADVGWGSDWYTTSAYAGARNFTVPEAWRTFTGHYRSEDPWIGSLRIALRKGRLWLNGTVPLEAAPDGRFWWRDEPDSPEWVRFAAPANGVASAMVASGNWLPRIY